MKTIKYFYAFLAIVFMMTSCSQDAPVIKDPLVVSFKEKSINFNQVKDKFEVPLTLSENPTENGSVIISLKETNMTYGVDYKTIPEAEGGKVKIPFVKGKNDNLKLTYVSLIPPASSKRKLTLQISEIKYSNSLIQGFTEFVFSFEDSKGGIFEPTIGGPNEPNQVFIDLSGKSEHIVKRDTWTLGFYSGETFNVILNQTNYSSAGAIESTDIDAVKATDFDAIKPKVKGAMGDAKYVDSPDGDFSKNAIAEVSATASDNKVYLLYLGNSVPTEKPKTGSVNGAGEPLGYKKIRVLRKDNGYLLQYADLDDTTHKEVFISKSTTEYAFTYFDFKTEKIVNVAPRKTDWDISFTVFTNKMGQWSYGFSDYCYANFFGGVKLYAIFKIPEEKLDKFNQKYKNFIEAGLVENNPNLTYEKFTKDNLAEYESKLKNTRMMPGTMWRSVFKKKIQPVYFIIQDPEGNIYKLRILQMVNEQGERGYTKFEYELLK